MEEPMIATAEDRATWERNLTGQIALEFILQGQRETAHLVLVQSLLKQARWLDANDFALQPEYVWPRP